MHRLWLTSLLFFSLIVLTSDLVAQLGTPIPPGIRAADKAQDKADRSVEPPQGPVQKQLDPAELLQQADELLALAQQVHTDTRQATQGLLAKDLKDKLKRIEKLSKQLRVELTP